MLHREPHNGVPEGLILGHVAIVDWRYRIYQKMVAENLGVSYQLAIHDISIISLFGYWGKHQT